MSEYTKGPWRVRVNGCTASILTETTDGSYGKAVALCQQVHKPETIPNATLLAAAPELYEALQALRSFMWAEGYADQNIPMAQADAAIAKAEAR